MRADPPPASFRESEPSESSDRRAPRVRCPYLEQILRGRAGPFGMLTRYKADCHVDRQTHTFTGRHPSPPCITQPHTCPLWQSARAEEDRIVQRYTD